MIIVAKFGNSETTSTETISSKTNIMMMNDKFLTYVPQEKIGSSILQGGTGMRIRVICSSLEEVSDENVIRYRSLFSYCEPN